jgi:hypothetical protein
MFYKYSPETSQDYSFICLEIELHARHSW